MNQPLPVDLYCVSDDEYEVRVDQTVLGYAKREGDAWTAYPLMSISGTPGFDRAWQAAEYLAS